MIRQVTLRATMALTLAVLLAVSADSAQAALMQNYAYAFTSISYNPALPVSLGLTMYESLIFGTTESSTHTGDAIDKTDHGNMNIGSTDAQVYASALGIANAGPGVPFSSQSSSATTGGYLWLYNSNSFDVMLPIRSYHYIYAWANSEAPYSGAAYAIAETFVDIYNYDVDVTYTAEYWYGWARSIGTFGVAGPLIDEQELFYSVRLTPGNNYIVSRISVHSDGFVSVPNAVPEPGTLTLAGIGLFSFVGMAWRKRRLPV